MISRCGQQPVFCYRYQPLAAQFLRFPNDGGFSVTLHQDDRFEVRFFQNNQRVLHTATYLAPSGVRPAVRQAIEQAQYLKRLPTEMHTDPEHPARFVSRVGAEGCPMFVCDDIAQLIRRPLLDPDGRAARQLCSFIEDVFAVMGAWGIHMDLDGYVLDEDVIQPIDTSEPFERMEKEERFDGAGRSARENRPA